MTHIASHFGIRYVLSSVWHIPKGMAGANSKSQVLKLFSASPTTSTA